MFRPIEIDLRKGFLRKKLVSNPTVIDSSHNVRPQETSWWEQDLAAGA